MHCTSPLVADGYLKPVNAHCPEFLLQLFWEGYPGAAVRLAEGLFKTFQNYMV